jgi:hypothetical protein
MGAAVSRVCPRPPVMLAGGLVVAVLAIAALAAGHRAAPVPAPLPQPAFNGTLSGAPLQRANCTSWHAASPARRRQAVRALTATIGGASTSGGVGTTLPDRDVSALFDRVCSTPGTSSFALYLIYARAAAFSHQGHGPTPITAPPAQPPL